MFPRLAKNEIARFEIHSVFSSKANMSNWRLVHRDIRQYALYNPENPAVDGLLHDMATQKIKEIGGILFHTAISFLG